MHSKSQATWLVFTMLLLATFFSPSVPHLLADSNEAPGNIFQRSISANAQRTCAITSLAGLKCWGTNVNGELGDGSSSNRNSPVDVVGLTSGVSTVSSGESHTCAITTAGGALCWGKNSDGQLGDGTTSTRNAPTQVSGLTSGVSAIAAGRFHTCAVLSTGALKCWGYNSSGQLGDGTTSTRNTPVDIPGLSSGVSQVTVGESHTCVLTTSGAVKCWGNNTYGQLGNGSFVNSSTPVDVATLSSGVQALKSGRVQTCAITAAGGVKCWGYNGGGLLGNNSTTNSNTPVEAIGLSSGVTAIASGMQHSCALLSSGSAKCWGVNGSGQLGDGTTSASNSPISVTAFAGTITAISVGSLHTCILDSNSNAKCWGSNGSGQLGDGSNTDASNSVTVSAFTGVTTTTTTTTTIAPATTTTTATPGRTLKRNKTVRLTSLIAPVGRGKTTWSVSGRCKISRSNLVTPRATGMCRLTLRQAKYGSRPASLRRLIITVR